MSNPHYSVTYKFEREEREGNDVTICILFKVISARLAQCLYAMSCKNIFSSFRHEEKTPHSECKNVNGTLRT